MDKEEILKSEENFVDYVEGFHLQNLSGRETAEAAFRFGIEAAYEELK